MLPTLGSRHHAVSLLLSLICILDTTQLCEYVELIMCPICKVKSALLLYGTVVSEK